MARVLNRCFAISSLLLLSCIVFCVGMPQWVGAQEAACAREDFESVVDEAAEALRTLNRQNKPTFQENLRQLKDKRGWSHEEFLEKAVPYVRDDQINVFDRKSQQLLNEISTIGSEGSAAERPDCAVLIELRARMKVLVKTQTDKWSYMFGKLAAALTQ